MVTEEGDYLCADHGLRKRNRVIVDRNGHFVTKTTADLTTATSEKISLQVLGTVGSTMKSRYKTPKLMPVDGHLHLWPSVSMHRIAGVRMHDLIATLNKAQDKNFREFAQKVDEFRTKAYKWAMEQVNVWQSNNIQKSLRKGFGDQAGVYEFENKLMDAAGYVLKSKTDSEKISSTLFKEIKELSSRLAARATIFLRDANPKNQILQLDGLLGSELPEQCYAVGYFPLVDDQWYDPRIAELLLNKYPHEISWETVSSNIWQVDFELSSRCTTMEDDFIHILASEVFSFKYDDIVKKITNQFGEVEPEHVHETMLFRSFRAWARRLFYYNELPEIFATRYRHESLSHHRKFAQKAAEGLKGVLGKELLKLIQLPGY